MNTPKQLGWIKTQERRPSQCDFPVYYALQLPQSKQWMIWYEKDRLDKNAATHWMSAPPLPDPPKYKTLEELDEEAFLERWTKKPFPFFGSAWHAGIAYERERCKKLLSESKEVNFIEVPGIGKCTLTKAPDIV